MGQGLGLGHDNKRGLLSGLWDLLVVKSKREGAFFEGQHNIMKTVRWGMSKEIQRNNSFAAFSASKKSGRSAKTRSRSKSADPEQSKKETNDKKPSSILKENAEMLGQLAQVCYFWLRQGRSSKSHNVRVSVCLFVCPAQVFQKPSIIIILAQIFKLFSQLSHLM